MTMLNFKKYLLESYMSDDEKKSALERALKQVERQYAPPSEEQKKKAEIKRKKQITRNKQHQIDQKKKHEDQMKNDPEYRKKYERELEQTGKAWQNYGELRAKGDPSVVSKTKSGADWTGD